MLTIGINKNIINKGEASTQGWQNHTFASIQEFAKHIKQGYAWTCGTLANDNLNKKPSNDDIKHASLVAIDVDNSTKKKQRKTQREGYISLDTFLKSEFYQKYGTFCYTTPNNTEMWSRFRAVFLLPYDVQSIEYKRIATALVNLYNADHATDISRLWFGSKNCYVHFNNNSISAAALTELTANKDFDEKVEELDNHYNANSQNRPQFSIEDLQYILSKIPENPGYNEWLFTLSGIANYLNNDTLAETIIDNWSPCTGKQTTLDKIRNRTKHTIAYVIRLALEYAHNDARLNEILKSDTNTSIVFESSVSDVYSDKYNARKFCERYSNVIKYNHSNGKWLVWNGIKWEYDETGKHIFALRDKFIDEQIKIIKNKLNSKLSDDDKVDAAKRKAAEQWIKSICSKRRQDDFMKLATQNAKIAVSNSDLDSHKHLINLINGTYDLDTLTLKKHDPNDLITKQLYFNYDINAKSPYYFDRVIRELLIIDEVDTEDENSLLHFFYESVALCLHGDIFTEAIWFMFGSGANGKTVISSFLFDFFGDYAKKLPASSLIERGETIPNDIAMLTGARFVLAEEMPDGKMMNVSKIKEITGGDKLTARFLHQEFFEYTPQFKLWLYGNNKPTIRDNSEGFWRRIKLIPFEYTVPYDQRVPKSEIHNAFWCEVEGLFNDLVKHLVEYRKRQRLLEPARSLTLINEYRADNDVLVDFLAEYCIKQPYQDDLTMRGRVPLKDLYKLYKTYAENNGEKHIMTNRTLKKKLCERDGITYKRFTDNKLFITGISLKSEFQNQLETDENSIWKN